MKEGKMSKQTAVEWLIEQIQNRQNGVIKDFPVLSLDEIFEQAKAMEKQQIVDAHEQGMICCMVEKYIQECDFEPYSEKYYHETYGGKND
jgi:hypothetical protein